MTTGMMNGGYETVAAEVSTLRECLWGNEGSGLSAWNGGDDVGARYLWTNLPE
jgi:hypothetical protein